MSTGYLTSGNSNGTPVANFNLAATSASAGNWELRVQLKRLFTTDIENDRQFLYSLLIPKKVGCDIDIISSIETHDDTSLMFQDADGKWNQVEDPDDDLRAQIVLNDTPVDSRAETISNQVPAVDETIGCFKKVSFELAISDEQETMCDVIVCFSGTFAIATYKSLPECQQFPVYVSVEAETSAASVDNSLTTSGPA